MNPGLPWALTNPEVLNGGCGIPRETQTSSSYLIFRGANILNGCATDSVLNTSYAFCHLILMIMFLHRYYSNFHFRNEQIEAKRGYTLCRAIQS